jgi:SHAQKYF class myb-like DNA-binding protein
MEVTQEGRDVSEHELPAGRGSKKSSRKPYTMTKPRERWTDQEHELFLEALRVHGRQWRKISAHVKTKSSVQIRSHAQKFFNKVEKQKKLLSAGLPLTKSKKEVPLDIEVPPPRPKRKLDGDEEQGKHLRDTQHQGKDGSGPYHSDYTTVIRNSGGDPQDVTVAAAVVAAAGKEIEERLQMEPPSIFPFFGMAPSMLRAMSNPAHVQANMQAALANFNAPVPTGMSERPDKMSTQPKKKAKKSKEEVERTGTSEPGVMHTHVNFHGEDGEGSACSREDAQTEKGDDPENSLPRIPEGGKVQNSSGNSSLARLLQPQSWNPSQGQLAGNIGQPFPFPSTAWTSQYSDPNVSNMWHIYASPNVPAAVDGGAAAQKQPLKPNVKQEVDGVHGTEMGSKTSVMPARENQKDDPEGSGSNPTGNGSSGNDSVHPNGNGNSSKDAVRAKKPPKKGQDTNAKPALAHEVVTRQRKSSGKLPAPIVDSTAKDGLSGGGSNENGKNGSGGGSNEKNGSGDGSNDAHKGKDAPLAQASQQKAPDAAQNIAQDNLSTRMAHNDHARAISTAMQALQSAGFHGLITGQPYPGHSGIQMPFGPSWHNVVTTTGVESLTAYQVSQISKGTAFSMQAWSPLDDVPRPPSKARSSRRANPNLAQQAPSKNGESSDGRNKDGSSEDGRSTPSMRKSSLAGRGGRKKSRPQPSDDC